MMLRFSQVHCAKCTVAIIQSSDGDFKVFAGEPKAHKIQCTGGTTNEFMLYFLKSEIMLPGPPGYPLSATDAKQSLTTQQ